MIAAYGSMKNGAAVAAGQPRAAPYRPNHNLLKYRLNIFARRAPAAMARGVEIG
jgi:hypothetical protein